MTLFKRFNQFMAGHKIMTAVMAVALIGAAGFGVFWNQRMADAANDADCSNYAIIKCGAYNSSQFTDKYKKSSELKKIYAEFGLKNVNDIKEAKNGTLHKDGTVKVDGQVVATDAQVLRRVDGTDKKKIDGKTYYLNDANKQAKDKYDAMVVFDDNSKVKFVVLKRCGNPIDYEQPEYHCDMLQSSKISRDKYEFSSKATAKNGAKIDKVVYDFGDGNKKEEKNPSTKVQHTYKKPGNYTAKVTVHFSVHGKNKTHTSSKCEKPIKVEEAPKPVYECKQLAAALVPNTKNKYSFTATGRAENGAKLMSGNFDFGDGNSKNDVAASGDTVKAEHEYAQSGEYTITATLKFLIGGYTEVEKKCSTTVKPEVPQPMYECTGLDMTKVSRTQYDFKASSTTKDVEVVGYRYTVTGPETAEQQLGEGETFSFTSQTPGTYTVNAYVVVKVDGQTKEATSAQCAKQFTIEEAPVAECTTLIATLQEGTRGSYDYETQVNLTGDAQVVDYTYDFGDGSAPQTTTEPTTSYTYATAGEYTTTVTVKFTVEGQEVTSQCQAATPVEEEPEYCEVPGKEHLPPDSPECYEECEPGIPVGDERCEEQPEECKPGIPVGDVRCEEQPEEPCPYDANLPKESKECVETPAELPATGPASIIGGAIGLSSLAGAGYYWRASRSSLLDRFRNLK